MTREELGDALRIYTEQIQRLIDGNAFWALLHYLVILPDICSALESSNGEATGKRYVKWVNRYLADTFLSGGDWHETRNLLLHQGRTLGTRRYSNYQFGQPNVHGAVIHKNIVTMNGVSVIVLDVNEFARGIAISAKVVRGHSFA